MKEKFYWINIGRLGSSFSGDTYTEQVISEHPFEFIFDKKSFYDDGYKYYLSNWREITEEEFKLFRQEEFKFQEKERNKK